MTRLIAFASALLLLPLVYWDYGNMAYPETTSIFQQIAESPRELVFWFLFGYPLMLAACQPEGVACRAFNFVMRKLA